MILSSHIFLVLLLSLLVHGAPNSTRYGLPDPGPLTYYPYELPENLKSEFRFSDLNKDPRPTGGVSPRLIITLTHGAMFSGTLVDVVEEDTWQRQDNKYPIPGMRRQIRYKPYETIKAHAIAFTREGYAILMPQGPTGTYIRESLQDIICLPSKNPGAQVIGVKDVAEVQKWCTKLYAGLEMDDRTFKKNMDRCSWVNLWYVGHGFVEVPHLLPPLLPPPLPPSPPTSGKKRKRP